MADVVVENVLKYAGNFYRNITHILDDMDATRWIRLIAVVGAYFLLRPYVLKFGAKVQAAEHEKEVDARDMKKMKAKISPNSLRGQVEIPDSDEEDEVESTSTSTEPQWGKKARKRSRRVLKKILEDQERLLEEDDNEDIKEFLESDVLVDYEEGKDGW
jgi:hypothetical protein